MPGERDGEDGEEDGDGEADDGLWGCVLEVKVGRREGGRGKGGGGLT